MGTQQLALHAHPSSQNVDARKNDEPEANKADDHDSSGIPFQPIVFTELVGETGNSDEADGDQCRVGERFNHPVPPRPPIPGGVTVGQVPAHLSRQIDLKNSIHLRYRNRCGP